MYELDAAIVKYHEVRIPTHISSMSLTMFQTLSIDPINGHILELLNLALESNSYAGPLGQRGLPGGDEEWERRMREHRKKGKAAERTARVEDHDSMSM